MCVNGPLRTDKLLAWKYLDSRTRRHDGNDVLSKVEYHVTRMRSLFEGDVRPVSSDSTVTLDTSLNNQSIQAADSIDRLVVARREVRGRISLVLYECI